MLLMIRKRKLFFFFLFSLFFAAGVFAFEHRRGIKRKAKSALITIKSQIKADTLQMLRDFTLQSSVRVKDAALNEASGIAPSFTNAGMFYTHNDSGNENLVFLIDKNGNDKAILKLKDSPNIDWEDIASGPGPQKGKSYIYVADIGDNGFSRPSVFVYRFSDEKISGKNSTVKKEISADKIELKYPDGSRNAETLMLDPKTRDLYIISKEKKQGGVYVARYPQQINKVNTLEKLGTVPIDRATGGSISADGRQILIKDYFNIYYWPVTTSSTLMQAMEKQRVRVAYNGEMQGEAVSWLPGGNGYVTISESPLKRPVDIFIYKK